VFKKLLSQIPHVCFSETHRNLGQLKKIKIISSAIGALMGWQDGHLAHKTYSTNPRGSLQEQMDESDLRGNHLTKVYLKKLLLNRNSSVSS